MSRSADVDDPLSRQYSVATRWELRNSKFYNCESSSEFKRSCTLSYNFHTVVVVCTELIFAALPVAL